MKLLLTHKEAIDNVLKGLSKEYKNCKDFCDLGCGNGERTILFLDNGRKVTGIDSQDYRTDKALKFRFIKKDFFKNNLPAHSFDLILNFDVIEHMEEPEKLLREIRRLLKKDGILILSTPNKYRLLAVPLLLLGLRRFPYCISEKNKEKYPEYWHLREYSTREINEVVIKNKFKILEKFKVFYGITGGKGIGLLFNLPFFHNHIMVVQKVS